MLVLHNCLAFAQVDIVLGVPDLLADLEIKRISAFLQILDFTMPILENFTCNHLFFGQELVSEQLVEIALVKPPGNFFALIELDIRAEFNFVADHVLDFVFTDDI